jgi:hypothetical protein
MSLQVAQSYPTGGSGLRTEQVNGSAPGVVCLHLGFRRALLGSMWLLDLDLALDTVGETVCNRRASEMRVRSQLEIQYAHLAVVMLSKELP